MRAQKPKAFICVGLCIFVIALLIASLYGPTPLRDTVFDAWVFVYTFRLPRVLCAAVIGALLALAGVFVQVLFRNPLAEPYVIGVSSGATVGAVLATLFIGSGLTFFAFIGSMSVCVFLWLMSSRYSSTHLLLLGIAINSLGGAFVALVSYWLPDEGLRHLWFWLLGGLQWVSWQSVGWGLLLVVASALWGLFQHKKLDWLSLGEPIARSHGVEVKTLSRHVLFWVAVMVAFSVSVAGMIGFVGLVVPHVVRMLVGGAHRWIIPLACVVGSVLLVLADWLCRILIAPEELPLGALTALAGAPVLLFLLSRRWSVRWDVRVD